MKLRIQDNSVRFRITIRELEQLSAQGELIRETRVPGAGENGSSAALFRYEVRREPDAGESRLILTPFAFTLALSEADFRELADPAREGAYIRREWTDEEGEQHRFLVFIEKDRPGSTCIKQEAWVYEQNPGGTPVTVPRTSRPEVKSS